MECSEIKALILLCWSTTASEADIGYMTKAMPQHFLSNKKLNNTKQLHFSDGLLSIFLYNSMIYETILSLFLFKFIK